LFLVFFTPPPPPPSGHALFLLPKIRLKKYYTKERKAATLKVLARCDLSLHKKTKIFQKISNNIGFFLLLS
jgi:hypothetical protein